MHTIFTSIILDSKCVLYKVCVLLVNACLIVNVCCEGTLLASLGVEISSYSPSPKVHIFPSFGWKFPIEILLSVQKCSLLKRKHHTSMLGKHLQIILMTSLRTSWQWSWYWTWNLTFRHVQVINCVEYLLKIPLL